MWEEFCALTDSIQSLQGQKAIASNEYEINAEVRFNF